MDKNLGRAVSVLACVAVVFGLGACASQERAVQTRDRPAGETRTDLTMDDLAGDWAFDADEAEAAVVEQVEASIAAIEDPEQRRQARSSMQEMTQPAVDALTGVTVTLRPDGSLRSTSVDVEGEREEQDGTWTLDDGIVVFSVRTDGRYDEDVSAARVIDPETMEMNIEDSAGPPMVLLLRKRS